MRTPNPAGNARARVVVDYGPDPADRHAAGLLADAVTRVQGFAVPAVVGADGDPGFTGYGPALQDFRGAANPAATTVVYRDGGNATISSGVVDGPMGAPARRIFAARMRRQGSM